MNVSMCDIHEIQKDAQVKFYSRESVSRCFMIYYIYTINVIVVKFNGIIQETGIP